MQNWGFIRIIIVVAVLILTSSILYFVLAKKPAVTQIETSRTITETEKFKSSPTLVPESSPLGLNSKIIQNGEYKTFQNERFGLEFTYLGDWNFDDSLVLLETTEPRPNNLMQVNVDNKVDNTRSLYGECPSAYVGIIVQAGLQRDNKRTFLEEIELFLKSAPGNLDVNAQITNTNLNKYKAFKVENAGNDIRTQRYFIEQDDKHFMWMGVTICPSVSVNDKQAIDKLLESLEINPRQY